MKQKQPLYIQVHPSDNVAIVANPGGVGEGACFSTGIIATERVPQGHKIALRSIEKDEAIYRYGEVIGYALEPIVKGAWVHEARIQLPTPPTLDNLPLPSMNLKNEIEPSTRTFLGYRNSNGSVGIKNILGITTSVQCVAGVLSYAVERIKKELLPLYEFVDDVISLTHSYGCGVAINAAGAEIPIRTLSNLSCHPNFGGEVLVIGLGCEKLQPNLIADSKSDIISLQDQQGFEANVKEIMKRAEEKLRVLNGRRREPIPIHELVIGVQCGGSDAFSGVSANPAVGYATDLLVNSGATVLFSEVTEVRDAIHLLTPRTANEKVREALINEMAWYDDYLAKGNADRSANPTPGNKKGGLSNVVEKALGSIIKSGTSPIVDVLAPGERVRKKGLNFAATPASDFICGTLQTASGIHLQVFTTGRGTPYNLQAVPVIKVSTTTSLKEKWHDLIDIDAGTIVTGQATIEEVGTAIYEYILKVASGEAVTWADRWGIANDLALFNPAPVT